MADYPKFDLLDTPDPDESVVAVTCEVDNIRLAQMPVEGVTTYAEFAAGDRCRVDEFGAYIYTVKTKPAAGLLTFHFAKPKTDAQKYTPFRTYDRTEEYPWYPVVEQFQAAPDITTSLEERNPGGLALYQIKWKVRYRKREMARGATTMEYREYLAPTKFTLRKPVLQQPVDFNWGDLPGVPETGLGSVLLTRRMKIPRRVVGPCAGEWQSFNPTSPAGWARHLVDADQVQDEATGLWKMVEKYARPPRQYRISRNH